MKCAIIILSLVALGYALPLTLGRNKRITIDEDDTVTIHGFQKKVVITKIRGSPGQRNVEVLLEDRTGPTRKIWFRDQGDNVQNEFGIQDPTEADILVKIFKTHQGTIDDSSLDAILQRIHHFVKIGQVDIAVLGILKSFDHQSQETNDLDETVEASSLHRLLKLLKLLGLNHKTIDEVDRILEENPVFIKKLVGHQLNSDQDDLINLDDILQQQHDPLLGNRRVQEEPISWTHKQKPFSINRLTQKQDKPVELDFLGKQKQGLLEGIEKNPFSRHRHDSRQDSWITQEDLFDKKIKELERRQELFTRPISSKFRHGLDSDDTFNHDQMLFEDGNSNLRKEMDPELLGDVMPTQQWLGQGDQIGQDQEEEVRTIQDQLMSQQGNPWQQRYAKFFSTPGRRVFDNQRLRF